MNTAGKVPVFGLLKRDGNENAQITKETSFYKIALKMS